MTKLWGGRFASGPSDHMAALSRSVHFDWVLAPYDILQSKAHARVLHNAGLLSATELEKMLVGLESLAKQIVAGEFSPSDTDEDVHTALERGLIEQIGPEVGGKLRAGRSRNDQVATDLRMYLRNTARDIARSIQDLQVALLGQAKQHINSAAPGFTHLQHAQPVSFGHELAKHIHAFGRDIDRLKDWDARADQSPMGSGALAGSSLNLDPIAVATELGFSGIVANSIDGVSDRDFVAEFLFVVSLIGVHLSRLGEEICLWTSREFAWAKLSDEWSTGSSIMPQKKNPDVAELARGKSGRLIGHVTGILTVLKGLPFAYNRDLQEDKESVIDAIQTLNLVLPAMSGCVATLEFDTERMSQSAPEGFALATDVAEWLVRKAIPFNQAHEIAGTCVKTAEGLGVELHQLTDEQLGAIDLSLTPEVREVLTVVGSLNSRSTPNGTAPASVQSQLEAAEFGIKSSSSWINAKPHLI
ncbi:MAG: argininosuccinate lyase [Actinomycetales bacterium]|nr:argininosuccinate lyase [Actinomycetales bacterium]